MYPWNNNNDDDNDWKMTMNGGRDEDLLATMAWMDPCDDDDPSSRDEHHDNRDTSSTTTAALVPYRGPTVWFTPSAHLHDAWQWNHHWLKRFWKACTRRRWAPVVALLRAAAPDSQEDVDDGRGGSSYASDNDIPVLKRAASDDDYLDEPVPKRVRTDNDSHAEYQAPPPVGGGTPYEEAPRHHKRLQFFFDLSNRKRQRCADHDNDLWQEEASSPNSTATTTTTTWRLPFAVTAGYGD